MKPADITQTATYYLAKNFKKLKGAMPSERYFLVEGTTVSESGREATRIAYGSAVDVLADLIEKGQFFGWYVSESVEQADNCNNAQILPLKDGDKIDAEFKVRISKDGLFIATQAISPKKYLDILRTPEGFKQSAGLLGVDGNLERIASTLYSSN